MSPEVALNSRPLKCFLALVVVILYGIPFYQTHVSQRETRWADLEISTEPPAPASAAEHPYFAEQFVNQAQPGVQCHVSAIAAAGDHRLICTWYAGSREGATDVAIFSAFFEEKTGAWTEPRVLVDRRRSSSELRRWVRKVGNAVVVNDNHGGLWLFYASLLGGWSTASLNYKLSQDGGQSWSASRKLILSPFFNLTNNVKNTGVNLRHGAFLLPVYHEFLQKFSQVLLLRADEPEPRYEIRRISDSRSAIQPALIPQGRKNLSAFFRNAAGGGQSHILKAESRDLGRSWSELTATPLPNPDAGFDMIRLEGDAILGAINNTFQDRHNLTLVISRDAGATWKDLQVIEHSPGREYSYPSLTRTSRYYHLTYTYERKRIKHVVFNEAWLQGITAYGR
jgi:predicted neuraminidase